MIERIIPTIVQRLICLFILAAPVAASANPQFKVAILVSSIAEESEGVGVAIESHLSDLPVELVVERTDRVTFNLVDLHTTIQEIANRVEARVVFFTDFSDPGRTVLYVSIPKVGTTLIRHIDCVEETIESRYEATAVIVRGILVAMLGGGEIGIHVPPPPPEESPDEGDAAAAVESTENQNGDAVSPGPEEAIPAGGATSGADGGAAVDGAGNRRRFQLETSYAFTVMSEDALAVHGLRTGVTGFLDETVYLFAGYRVTFPFTNKLRVSTRELQLDVTPHPIEVGAGMEWQWDDITFHTGGAVMLDVISWSATAVASDTAVTSDTDTEVTTRSDDTVIRLALSPFAVLGWQFTEAAAVFIALYADIFVYRQSFSIEADNGSLTELMSLWVVNPCFQVGLRFSLF